MIVHMIGNAHIDPVWLWKWQGGVDEALATFKSAADRCDEYPEFIFTRGEAWTYAQVERLDPGLFARVKKLIAEGRWEIAGSQWIQPDVNLPTAAGLRRQVERGREYFLSRFGRSATYGYNVDSFGHPATLPDILNSVGQNAYVCARGTLTSGQAAPQLFRWKGVAGGELLTFKMDSYVTRSDDLYGQIMNSVEAAGKDVNHTMCFYGVGNHGGGPTKGNIESILTLREELKKQEIEVRFSSPARFFAAVADDYPRLPIITEELQRTFPGCYSVMHDIKQAQRYGEHLLQQAARAVDLWSAPERSTELAATINRAWDDLLFTEFHDILAGTSIPPAWEGVRAMQGRARIIGEEVLCDVTRGWSRAHLAAVNHQQIALFNADIEPFEDIVEHEPFLDFDAWGDRWLSDSDGRPIDYQLVSPQAAIWLSNAILLPANIPAGGVSQLLIRDDPKPAVSAKKSTVHANAAMLSNDVIEVHLTPAGIGSIVCEKNVLIQNIALQLRQDITDTWVFTSDTFAGDLAETFTATGSWIVEETGPLRARARLDGRIGNSQVRWTASVLRGQPRLDLRLEITFADHVKLLQMPVTLAKKPTAWRDGLAGGGIDRQLETVEFPLQGWSRMHAGGYDIGTVTQDAYSISLRNATAWWTLIRSPRMACAGAAADIDHGHMHLTDQGAHVFDFTFALGRSILDQTLDRMARQRAQAPIAFDRYEGMARPPWKNNPAERLWTGNEWRAKKDGRMAHLQSPEGEHGKAL